jgi:hypothetical protein
MRSFIATLANSYRSVLRKNFKNRATSSIKTNKKSKAFKGTKRGFEILSNKKERALQLSNKTKLVIIKSLLLKTRIITE